MTPPLLHSLNLVPTNVEDAHRSLRTAASRLYAADFPVAAFAEVYAITTQRVAEGILDGNRFCEPEWVSRLSGHFAARYFENLGLAIHQKPARSRAWAKAMEREFRIPALQALLGVNAHINYDLAQSLAESIEETGRSERMLERYRHDHEAINEILGEVVPEVLFRLEARYGCPGARQLTGRPLLLRATTWLVKQLLRQWRREVWTDLLDLLQQRPGVLRRMDERASRWADLLALAA